jgi:hypothetical protein
MERIKIIKPKLRGLMLVALAVGPAAHAQVGVELSDRAQALYQDVQYSVGMQSNLGRATYCLSTYAQSLAACEVGGMPVAIPVGVCDAYTGGSQYSAQPCGSTALQALNVGYAVLDAINSEGQGYETILRHYEPISYAIQRVGEVYSGATQPVPPAPYPPYNPYPPQPPIVVVPPQPYPPAPPVVIVPPRPYPPRPPVVMPPRPYPPRPPVVMPPRPYPPRPPVVMPPRPFPPQPPHNPGFPGGRPPGFPGGRPGFPGMPPVVVPPARPVGPRPPIAHPVPPSMPRPPVVMPPSPPMGPRPPIARPVPPSMPRPPGGGPAVGPRPGFPGGGGGGMRPGNPGGGMRPGFPGRPGGRP